MIKRLLIGIIGMVTIVAFSASLINSKPVANPAGITLGSIQTDKVVVNKQPAATRANRAWFVEMVLPTRLAKANHGAWFVEMVAPNQDSGEFAANLKSAVSKING